MKESVELVADGVDAKGNPGSELSVFKPKEFECMIITPQFFHFNFEAKT